MQSKPLKDEIVEILSKTIEMNTNSPLATTTENLTVETTTLFDDEATTEYPTYGDEEDDQINGSLAISLSIGR